MGRRALLALRVSPILWIWSTPLGRWKAYFGRVGLSDPRDSFRRPRRVVLAPRVPLVLQDQPCWRAVLVLEACGGRRPDVVLEGGWTSVLLVLPPLEAGADSRRPTVDLARLGGPCSASGPSWEERPETEIRPCGCEALRSLT